MRNAIMQVEAIYRHGKLELLQPVHFKSDSVRLVVIVADSEIEADAPSLELPSELRDRAQAELDRYRAVLCAPMQMEAALPEVGREYEDRLTAFEWRTQARLEQGRPG
jgi:hypothetical protein